MSANSHCPTRLLLVDDDPELLELWEHVLREAFDGQIHIDALSDSNAAIKLVQRHSFDILVTDLSMPDVNGLDLIRCVQSRNRCAQTLAARRTYDGNRHCHALSRLHLPSRAAIAILRAWMTEAAIDDGWGIDVDLRL